MERNIKNKIDIHTREFKDNIKNYMEKLTITDSDNINRKQELLQYIFDYNSIELQEEDFKKRKRIKNTIPNFERCCALRSNNERCTRKKKDNQYCGTHIKGTPYGTISNNIIEPNIKKIEIWLEEINGIHQFIDNENNVYSTEDINNSINPPRIIHNWYKDKEGKYFIK